MAMEITNNSLYRLFNVILNSVVHYNCNRSNSIKLNKFIQLTHLNTASIIVFQTINDTDSSQVNTIERLNAAQLKLSGQLEVFK